MYLYFHHVLLIFYALLYVSSYFFLLSSKFRARLLFSEKLANPYKLTNLENFFDKEKLKAYFNESKNFWYNFSRDLASYSLLSSQKKKKFRKKRMNVFTYQTKNVHFLALPLT